MSEGEKVYKIRNKRTGEWLSWDPRFPHHFPEGTKGSLTHDQILANVVAVKSERDCEIVEFTLSNPRVVEQS